MQVIKHQNFCGKSMWQKYYFPYFFKNEQCLMPFYPALQDLDGWKKSSKTKELMYKDVPFVFMSLACIVFSFLFFYIYTCRNTIIVQNVIPNLGHMFSISHSKKFRAQMYKQVLMVGELGKCALQENVRNSLFWSTQKDQWGMWCQRQKDYSFSLKTVYIRYQKSF